MPSPLTSSPTTKRSAREDGSETGLPGSESSSSAAMICAATQALSSTVPRPAMTMSPRFVELCGRERE